MSAFTVGDFQSTHHHSFIDSSGSASIPSSLIHKLRTAILIALRTVEVFNGLLCSRGIRTVQCADSRCEVFQKHHAYSWEIHQRQVFTKETEHSFPQIAAISWSQHHTYTHTEQTAEILADKILIYDHLNNSQISESSLTGICWVWSTAWEWITLHVSLRNWVIIWFPLNL